MVDYRQAVTRQNKSLDSLKGNLMFRSPRREVSVALFTCQRQEDACVFSKLGEEGGNVAYKPKEMANLFGIAWVWPVHNSLYFR